MGYFDQSPDYLVAGLHRTFHPGNDLRDNPLLPLMGALFRLGMDDEGILGTRSPRALFLPLPHVPTDDERDDSPTEGSDCGTCQRFLDLEAPAVFALQHGQFIGVYGDMEVG